MHSDFSHVQVHAVEVEDVEDTDGRRCAIRPWIFAACVAEGLSQSASLRLDGIEF